MDLLLLLKLCNLWPQYKYMGIALVLYIRKEFARMCLVVQQLIIAGC